jgi:selenide,water dikinase
MPWLPGARGYAEAGLTPGGTARNRDFVAPHARFAERVDAVTRLLLYDPQTSGGLLAAVAPAALDAARAALAAQGVACHDIGEVIAGATLDVE